jgi:hypothetical protein
MVVSPFILAAVLLLLASSAHGQVAEDVPTPESHFGFAPGSDRRLADWHELTAYYDRVAELSPRVVADTLGPTTRGLPMVMLTITSPENHGRLAELRDIHLRLADPRRLTDAAELARVKDEARAVVLVTSHIHSTEVGAGQFPPNLLYRLATSTDSDVLDILDRVILLHVPSLNPDGTQMVAEWYRAYVGTAYEAAEPVELYHHYVGHDNNRDWYALTQIETQLTVEKAHNAWRPMIVHDVHQMGEVGPRMFVPPYVDPFERNVDPLLVTAINQLGSYMAADLSLEGKAGVATGTQFDIYTPSRAYSHYHGGVRILSETASARLATPIYLEPEELGSFGRGGRDAATMSQPLPWAGGEWGLPRVVEYQEAGVMALLRNAARNRRFWVDNFYEVNRRAVVGWPSWPRYWVIPEVRGDRVGLDAMLRILTMGSVEVHRASEPFVAGGRSFSAGTYVVPMNQPYASWAQTLLEVQEYPDLRDDVGGAPVRPYDVTAHTLPLLMGVEAYPVAGPAELRLSDPIPQVPRTFTAPGWLTGVRHPRIGLYRGARESIPSGWTRWLFDMHQIDYVSLTDGEVRGGGLENGYDVIVLQDQAPIHIRSGWRMGQAPPEFTGGLGPEGLESLRQFVLEGGRLVAIESATDLVIDLFSLAVQNHLAGVPAASFYIPGSILRLDLDSGHPLANGAGRSTSAWFWRTSRAFRVAHPAATVVARYGAGEPRQSGWVLGSEHIAGRPAIVEMRVGRGSIVLFGFQPNYRGHSIATWPLLFNSLRWERASPRAAPGEPVANCLEENRYVDRLRKKVVASRVDRHLAGAGECRESDNRNLAEFRGRS